MSVADKTFHRLFAKTMYKNLKLSLGEMSFAKDFVTDTRGDMYPVVDKSDDLTERVYRNRYQVERGCVKRWMGAFFPYASYEVCFTLRDGSCGFEFVLPVGRAQISYDGKRLNFISEGVEESVPCAGGNEAVTLVISLRPGYFDVYFVDNGQPMHQYSFQSERFACSHDQKCFQKGYTALCVDGEAEVSACCSYIDSGVSQADIRPVRYENGQVMLENGRVYLTVSIRMQAGMMQGIMAWTPSTDRFELTGALYYDSGDGLWCSDVAASVLYHREKKLWYLWVCSFSHDHVLGHGVFEGDPRFGVNVVDITLMEKAGAEHDVTDFVGFSRDEDPDFYFDEEERKWYMAICRVDPETKNYRYVFFASEQPFEGYRYIGRGFTGAETGGSFQKIDGERIFVCGNAFDKTSNYRIYNKTGMKEAMFDFPDGGFRGWGTLIPVKMGSRERIFWLTFDRHKGSDYNWSYGNVYGFEAEKD